MDAEALDVMRKLTVVMVNHRAALDRLVLVLEKNNQALDLAVSLPVKLDLVVEQLRKNTAATDRLAKALDKQVVPAEAPVEPVDNSPPGKPIPDRHDRANLEHAERQLAAPFAALSPEDRAHHEEVVRDLHAKFDWSAKRRAPQ